MKTVVTDEFLLPLPIVQNRNMNLNGAHTNVYVLLIKAKPLKGLLKIYNSFVIIPFINTYTIRGLRVFSWMSLPEIRRPKFLLHLFVEHMKLTLTHTFS